MGRGIGRAEGSGVREKRILEWGESWRGSSRDSQCRRREMHWEVKRFVCVKEARNGFLTKHTQRRLFHQGQYSSGGPSSMTQNPLPQGKASWGVIFSGESVQLQHTHTYTSLYQFQYPTRAYTHTLHIKKRNVCSFSLTK